MNKMAATNIIESQCSYCKRNPKRRKMTIKRSIWKSKKLNLCILKDLATTLTSLVMRKNKEAVTILKQYILSIAEKI